MAWPAPALSRKCWPAAARISSISRCSAMNRTATTIGSCCRIFFPALSSTLADLGGVGEGILHAVPDTARNFDTIPARPGHERNLMAPYFATYRGDCIAEG